MDSLTIGKVAKQAGINLQTIRYYERQGILAPMSRTDAGYRVFSSESVRRIQFIKRAQELGFSLKEIKDLLSLRLDAHTTQADIRNRTQAKIADVERKILHLQAIHASLLRMAKDCSGVWLFERLPHSRKPGWKGVLMTNRTWGQNLLAVPGIGLSVLPKIACPACWPAYAGLLSSVGLGFLVPNSTYLLPLTVVFLLIAVGALAIRARQRRGYAPAILGVIAAAFILLGKFSLASNPTFYVGLGLLILASVWNSWPVSSRCACAPAAETLYPSGAHKEK